MNNHLFTCSYGNLYDTRVDDWENKKPLRVKYSTHITLINSVSDLKSCLRAGKYSWPGGYEVSFLTKNGGNICWNCAYQNFKWIIFSVANQINDGWLIDCIMITVNNEGDDCCDHCHSPINLSDMDNRHYNRIVYETQPSLYGRLTFIIYCIKQWVVKAKKAKGKRKIGP
jgi:hypothetical protein